MQHHYSTQLKAKVRKLRSRGKTYTEITDILQVWIPKSTLSYLCEGVALPRWYQKKVDKLNAKNFTKAQKMAWVSNKNKRERLLHALVVKNNYLLEKLKDENVLKMLLAVLYLGEGAKWRSHRGLMLGSSDPLIIKLYMRLLRLCYGIFSEKLRCRVSYRADQDINKLQRYWSRITAVPLRNFYKTKPDPRTVGKITQRNDYKGVCVLTCGGTHIQLELETIPKIIFKGI